jgi:hypothetical protein
MHDISSFSLSNAHVLMPFVSLKPPVMPMEVFDPTTFDPTAPAPGSSAPGARTPQSSAATASQADLNKMASLTHDLVNYTQRRPDAHLRPYAQAAITGATMVAAYPRELTSYSVDYTAKALSTTFATASAPPARAHDASALNPIAHPYTVIGQSTGAKPLEAQRHTDAARRARDRALERTYLAEARSARGLAPSSAAGTALASTAGVASGLLLSGAPSASPAGTAAATADNVLAATARSLGSTADTLAGLSTRAPRPVASPLHWSPAHCATAGAVPVIDPSLRIQAVAREAAVNAGLEKRSALVHGRLPRAHAAGAAGPAGNAAVRGASVPPRSPGHSRAAASSLAAAAAAAGGLTPVRATWSRAGVRSRSQLASTEGLAAATVAADADGAPGWTSQLGVNSLQSQALIFARAQLQQAPSPTGTALPVDRVLAPPPLQDYMLSLHQGDFTSNYRLISSNMSLPRIHKQPYATETHTAYAPPRGAGPTGHLAPDVGTPRHFKFGHLVSGKAYSLHPAGKV